MVERKQVAMSAPQCHPYQLFYNQALTFLKEHLPEGITEKKLNRYFLCDNANYKNISDVFERFITSAQNYQSMPNVIKFSDRKSMVKKNSL